MIEHTEPVTWDTLDENDPIYKAIDLGGGQDVDIPGVLNELDKAGFTIVPKAETEWQPIKTAPVGKRLQFWWRPIDNNPYAESVVTGSLCSPDSKEAGKWWNDQTAVYQGAWHLTNWRKLPTKPSDRT